MSYSNLAPGQHTFRVTASNTVGFAEDSATWTVTAANTTTPTSITRRAVEAPRKPASYALPAAAVRVTTTAELAAALQATPATDIVLAAGVYDNATPLSNYEGHRLWAEQVGAVTLKFGLGMGSNWSGGGGLVRGVTFDVDSGSKAFADAIVHVWGPGGANTSVLDCVFRGNYAVRFGLLAFNVTGLDAQRLEFYGFTDAGLRASDQREVAYGGQTSRIDTVWDIYVDGVSRPVPGSSFGTDEAGVWIGNPVTGGVKRIAVRNTAWSGIEVVNNSWDTVFSDLDIDMSGRFHGDTGIYLEHYSYNNVFENFEITGARVGITAEWADPGWGGRAAAHFTIIRNGSIDAAGTQAPGNQAGVYLDEGTESTTVTNVVFQNQNWAAIGAYKNVGTNRFENNDYSGIGPQALPVKTSHMGSS
jgi:hypothetical protein